MSKPFSHRVFGAVGWASVLLLPEVSETIMDPQTYPEKLETLLPRK